MTEQVTPTADAIDWAREQARRRLLSLLDVEPLVSRYDPPGAAPAMRSLAPIAPAETISEQNNSRAVRPTTHQTTSITAAPSLTNTVASTKSATTQQANHNEVATPYAEVQAVQFSLLMVSAGNWLWVESLPDRLLRQAQVGLVKAMAAAISGAEHPANYRQFDWPMSDNLHLARDLETGRESVAGLLMRMQREVKAKGVILMGDAVSEFCPIPQGLAQHAIPSTLTMIENPLLKIDAWKTLQPLLSVPNTPLTKGR